MSGSETRRKVIVFKKFDTPIEANLAKTKLDAHGIPCFLTEENLASLYPGQSFDLFGVRLHVFEKDAQQVADVLNDQQVTEPDVCPKCHSEDVTIEYSRNFFSVLATVLTAVFVQLLPNKKVFRCKQCGHEF